MRKNKWNISLILIVMVVSLMSCSTYYELKFDEEFSAKSEGNISGVELMEFKEYERDWVVSKSKTKELKADNLDLSSFGLNSEVVWGSSKELLPLEEYLVDGRYYVFDLKEGRECCDHIYVLKYENGRLRLLNDVGCSKCKPLIRLRKSK